MVGEVRLLGAVLAGGASVRFGRDKALETIAGRTLLDRAIDTLGAVTSDVVVVGGHNDGVSSRVVADLRPGAGPLAGIEAALTVAVDEGYAGVFVLACDLPLVTPGTVRAVALALGEDAAAAPARSEPPGVEPLCGAYRTSCLGAARSLLDEGRGAAHALFAAVSGVRVPLPQEEFLNVNTPEAADAARALLEERGG